MLDNMVEVNIKDKEEFIHVVYEIFFCHVINHFVIVLRGNWLQMISSTSGTCWDINIKDKEEFIK